MPIPQSRIDQSREAVGILRGAVGQLAIAGMLASKENGARVDPSVEELQKDVETMAKIALAALDLAEHTTEGFGLFTELVAEHRREDIAQDN